MIDVDLVQLSLAQQVIQRQADHAAAVGEHLQRYARLDAGELGLILQLAKPIADAFVDTGSGIADLSARASMLGAERMSQTIAAYQQAESEAHEAASVVASALGVRPGSYAAPSAPTLGAAGEGAPSRYDDPDGNLFNQAFWDGYSAAEWAAGTGEQAGSRVVEGLSATRGVTEVVDVRSYLPAPHGEDPEIESIRWKAGPIFGGVDWLWEQLMGYSLLEEVTKPFAGDWERMREAQFAWKHAGDAMTALSRNYAGLLPPLGSWTGRGSEAFLAAAAVMSQAHTTVSGPAGTISSSIKVLVLLCKEVVGLILRKLKQLGDKLVRMAAEAAVPVAGWIAAAVEGGVAIYEFIKDAQTIYKWLNLIYDLVSGMVSGLSAATDSAFRMADLYEGLARAGAARV